MALAQKSVTIYSPKTGEKLCELFPRLDTVWTIPNTIEQWAWCQSYLIKDSWNKLLLIAHDLINQKGWPPFKVYDNWMICYCLNCIQPTVKMATLERGPFYLRKVHGFACENPSCPNYQILIPLILFKSAEEIPDKYLHDVQKFIEHNKDKLLELQTAQVRKMLQKQNYFPPA